MNPATCLKKWNWWECLHLQQLTVKEHLLSSGRSTACIVETVMKTAGESGDQEMNTALLLLYGEEQRKRFDKL